MKTTIDAFKLSCDYCVNEVTIVGGNKDIAKGWIMIFNKGEKDDPKDHDLVVEDVVTHGSKYIHINRKTFCCKACFIKYVIENSGLTNEELNGIIDTYINKKLD